MNITAHSHFSLLDGQRTILEMVATGAPLMETLQALTRVIEAQEEGLRCGILIVTDDGRHFRRGVGPNLPEIYHQTLDGVPISPPYLGACGEAADQGMPIIVPDIASDTRWSNAWRDLTLSCGLKSLRSTPVFSSDGRVLASFAMYYGEPRDPQPANPELIETAAHLAGIVLERARREEELKQRDARYRALIDQSISGVAETNASGRFIEVNDRYCAITGYSRDELLGLHMQDITHPDDLQQNLVLFERLATGGSSF